MEHINNFLRKVGAEDMKAKASEANYILFDHKPQELPEKEIIDKARLQVTPLIIYISQRAQGICAGFSLALSLRRYMPTTFGEISLRRCITDAFLTLAGYSACSYVGMEIALDNTKNLRKALILQKNDEYLRHLEEKRQEFPNIYRTERDLFTEVMKDEEYDEWVKKNDDNFQR